MRHRVRGKQLSRSTPHRRALRRNMAASLFQHGAIRTTETKAKHLKAFVEKLITIAKDGTLKARRRVIAELQDREMWNWDDAEKDYVPDEQTVVEKLFNDIAPMYADRQGGYTRIIRLPDRRIGDAGVQVILQLVEQDAAASGGGGGRRKRRAADRYAFAKAGLGGKTATQAEAEEAPAETTPADEVDEPAEAPDTEAPADEQPQADAPAEDQAGDDDAKKE